MRETAEVRHRRRARSLTLAIGLLNALFVPLHLVFLERHLAVVMAPLAALSSVSLFALWRYSQSRPELSTQCLGWLIACVLSLNSALHLGLDGNLIHTTNTALLVVGIGAYFFDWRWLVAAYGVSLGSWAVAASFAPSEGLGHYVIALGLALFASVVFFRVRLDDARQLDAATEELSKLARRDPLTELSNRADLDDQLPKLTAFSARTERPMAILLCDVDHFKEYNDHRGHLDGDRLLKDIARALEAVARRSLDIVARWGGDEFVLVLPDTTEERARELAERIRLRISELDNQCHVGSDVVVTVTLSIGLAVGVPQRDAVAAFQEDALAAADRAMYRAKGEGGGRVSVSGFQ